MHQSGSGHVSAHGSTSPAQVDLAVTGDVAPVDPPVSESDSASASASASGLGAAEQDYGFGSRTGTGLVSQKQLCKYMNLLHSIVVVQSRLSIES